MKGYFVSVILAALFGGICEEMLPDSSSVRPHVRLVTGLCVLAVLVLPAKDLLSGLGDFFTSIELGELIGEPEENADYEALFESSMSQSIKAEAEAALVSMLTERFDLKAGTCRVTLTLSSDGGAERCLVCLSGSSILQSPYEIEAYVNELLSCPCDVATE